jgi:hypothetical protein
LDKRRKNVIHHRQLALKDYREPPSPGIKKQAKRFIEKCNLVLALSGKVGEVWGFQDAPEED